MLLDGLCVLTILGITMFMATLLFKRCDGDLVLMWKAKFGRKVESLSGQVVWITGASSGIGETLAYRLAQVGCKLVLSARRGRELERVKTACLNLEGARLEEDDILVVPFDVADFESHAPVAQMVMNHFEKIDILINNAGKAQIADWTDVDIRVDRLMYELNVLGPVSLTRAVLPYMMARGKGHVVAMSSLAGKVGFPKCRSYIGSKYALNGYFDCLRTEIGKHNIGVTVLCPGPVVSNIFAKAYTGKVGQALEEHLAPSNPRMPTERCAHLCGVAIANRLYETWISQHPMLYITYLSQYIPDVARWWLLRQASNLDFCKEKADQ